MKAFKKIALLLSLVMVVVSMQIPVMVNAAAAGVVVQSAPKFFEGETQVGYPKANTTVKISIDVLGSNTDAQLLAGIYDGDALVKAGISSVTNVPVGAPTEIVINELAIPENFADLTMRIFVWDIGNGQMIPCDIPDAVELSGETTINRAMLKWDVADGLTKGTFDVYCDGEKIATAKENMGGYIHDVEADGKAHTYYVVDTDGRKSNTISLAPQSANGYLSKSAMVTAGATADEDINQGLEVTKTNAGSLYEYYNNEVVPKTDDTSKVTGYWSGGDGSFTRVKGEMWDPSIKGVNLSDDQLAKLKKVQAVDGTSAAFYADYYQRYRGAFGGSYSFLNFDADNSTGIFGTPGNPVTKWTVYVEYWGTRTKDISLNYKQTNPDLSGNGAVNKTWKNTSVKVDSTASNEWKIGTATISDADFTRTDTKCWTSAGVEMGLHAQNGALYIRRIAMVPQEYADMITDPSKVFEDKITPNDGSYETKYPDGVSISFTGEGITTNNTDHSTVLTENSVGITKPSAVGGDGSWVVAKDEDGESYLQIAPIPLTIGTSQTSTLKPRMLIDDAYLYGAKDNNVQVEIEYVSNGITGMQFAYPNTSGSNNATKNLTLTGDNTKRTATFELTDANFNNTCYGENTKPDFAILATTGVQNKNDNPTNYLHIYSIKIKNLNHRPLANKAVESGSVPTLYLMGDSICQGYADDQTGTSPGIKGWGQYIGEYLKTDNSSTEAVEGITIVNKAVAGSSTKTFPNYSAVYDNLKAGDYVTVQFGHNDSMGDSRGVDVATYKTNLQKIIDTVEEKGATPIFLTSIATYTRFGGINTGSGINKYREAMKEVASANEINVVDTYNMMIDLFDNYGWNEDPYGFIVDDDGVHLTEAGAREIAKAVVRGIKESDGLESLKMFTKSNSEIKASNANITNPATGEYLVYATAIYGNALVVEWGTPYDTSNINKYAIYRKLASDATEGDGTKIGESDIAAYYDTGLSAETEYIYTIYADGTKLGSQKIKTNSSIAGDPYADMTSGVTDESGLQLYTCSTNITDGYTKKVQVGDKWGRQTAALVPGTKYQVDSGNEYEYVRADGKTINSYAYFALTTPYISTDDKNITFEIEYNDSVKGSFYIQYNNGAETGAIASTSSVQMSGSGEWKTAEISVTNAHLWNNTILQSGHCIRIAATPGTVIGSVKIKKADAGIKLDSSKTNYVSHNEPQLFLASDSTCEDTSYYKPAPRSGWGMLIDDGKFDGKDGLARLDSVTKIPDGKADYFTAAVKTINKAQGGRTAQEFVTEAVRLSAVLNECRPGDYILIQFGHNDKSYAAKGEEKGTTVKGVETMNDPSSDSYEYWLKYICDRVSERGVQPIILDCTVNRTVVSDPDGDYLSIGDAGLEEYRKAAENLAKAINVPFIEVADEQLEIMNDWGVTADKTGSEQFHCLFDGTLYTCNDGNLYSAKAGTPDNTHLSDKGADEIAKIIVRGIKEGAKTDSRLEGLAQHINPYADITAGSPVTPYPWTGNQAATE